MNKSIVNFVGQLNRKYFTNNTQRVLHSLLVSAITGDGWMLPSATRTPNAQARIRDLRKPEFGALVVTARSASSLGKKGSSHDYFYSLDTKRLTVSQLKKIFNV